MARYDPEREHGYTATPSGMNAGRSMGLLVPRVAMHAIPIPARTLVIIKKGRPAASGGCATGRQVWVWSSTRGIPNSSGRCQLHREFGVMS